MKNMVEIRSVFAGYGDKNVLKNMNFGLKNRDFCALLGPNGCGKSTLLRTISGLLPYKGSCRVAGAEVQEMGHRQRAQAIGYLAQNPVMELNITVLDAVLMGANPQIGIFESPKKHHFERARKTLEQAGIGHLAQEYFHTLSAGQRQLVLLCRTLLRDISLICLDEPDSALDFANREKIFSWLENRAKSQNCALLMSSHDANFALRYAKRLLLMKKGEILYDITLDETDEAQLKSALTDIYGPIDLLRHKGYYIMTAQ